MADIFVSYRRDDSQWSAGRINDRLANEFGRSRVFFDTVTIEPGEDFVEVLGEKVGGCRVLLAVIGPRWLELLEARLGDANDFVRIEIAEALRRGVRVVPVLIDGAGPPPEARLPDDLKPLARRNAIWVRAQTFEPDVGALVGFLQRHLGGAAASLANNEARYRAEGRIRIDAAIPHGAPDGWFLPGVGKNEWFQDIPNGPEMVVVPAGSFRMGSSPAEIDALKKEFKNDWYDCEGPQRTVTIPKPFAVGRLAVTRGQFAAFVAATGHKTDGGAFVWTGTEAKHDSAASWRNPGFAQDDTHPVVCVNWDDAKSLVAWLDAKASNKGYRLLSEAEREYVARAGTSTSFWWGPSVSVKQANYDGDYTFNGSPKGEYRKRTMPAQSFDGNPWGLFQVHGNAYDWCEDVWHETYQGAPVDGEPWLQGGEAGLRVVRGGSWYNSPDNLRSANRYRRLTDPRASWLGLRVARTLTS